MTVDFDDRDRFQCRAFHGVLPNAVHSTMHLWYPGGKHTAQGDFFVAPGLTEDFHTYRVLVDEAHVT